MINKRLSNIELLRVICIIMILSMHIMGYAWHTSNTLNRELLLGINTISNSGVTIFILISGYFGIHFKVDKLVKFLFVVWTYSILSYIIEIWFLGTNISLPGVISTLFPVLTRKYWFISCYTILYCFSPYLNRLVKTLSKKEFEGIICIWALFFVVAPTIFFFEILNDGGKGIINMTLAYLIGQYLSVYGFPKIIKERSSILLVGVLIITFALNSILTEASGNIIIRLSRDNSLFIIMISILILYKALKHTFYSDSVNYLAGFVFPIYLLNYAYLDILAPITNGYVENNLFIFLLFGEIVLLVIITIIIESIRRLLCKKAEKNLIAFVEKKVNIPNQ